MFTSPSFSLSSSVFQCTEGNQKGDAFAPKTSTWASPLSSTTTFGAPSFAGFGSSMSALGFSSVHPFGSSQSTSVQGPHATSSISNFKQSHCGGQERGSRIENYKRTPGEIEFGEYVSISAMPIYKDKSHEELRWEDYKFTTKGPHAPRSTVNFKQSHCGGEERGSRIEKYKRTPAEIEFGEYVSISAMPVYKDKSHEELRWGDYKFTTKENYGAFAQTSSPFSSGPGFGSSTSPIGFSSPTMVEGSHSSRNICGCPQVLGHGYQKEDAFAPKTSFIETLYGSPTTSNYGGIPTRAFVQTSSPLVEGPHASRSTVNFEQSHCGGEERGSRIENYKRTPAEIEFGEYVSISAMPIYKDKSHEELRWEDYKFTTKGSHSSSGIYGCPEVLGQGYHKGDPFAPKTSSIETVYGSPTTSNYGGIPTWAFAQTSSPLVEGPHASRSTVNFKQSHCGGERGSRIENYKRTPAKIEFGEYVSISAMPVYKDKSHEELRWEDYQFTPKGGFGSSSSANPCSITAIANLTASLNKFNPFVPKTTLPSLPTHTSSSSPSFEKCNGTPLPPKSHLSLEGSPSIQYGISNIPVKEITVAAFVPRELAITGTMHEEKLPGSVYENDKDDPTEEKNLLPTILDAPSKLQLPDYYTIPHISELESKERAEPGFCSHVKEFVIGRIGHGSIKFLGETDVRNLDLETFVQFNNRELIVYMDETKKPPVGQGLNKPAEITLLNIKCIDKRSRVRYEEGPMIDKYREMLKKKVAAQGGEFISYHPVEGEWKFRVQHF